MEKAQGIQLKEVWDVMPMRQKCKFLAELVSIEAKMLSTSVDSYGALYYNGDVPNGKLIRGKEEGSKFCIGPSVRRSYWEGEKAGMDIDRGPCKILDVLTDERGILRAVSCGVHYARGKLAFNIRRHQTD